MTTKPKTKWVLESDFVVEIQVELIEMEDGWSPHLSVEDAKKLDEAREALRRGDRPGGVRAVIAESVLTKHQLLILNRSRQRAPNLRTLDRRSLDSVRFGLGRGGLVAWQSRSGRRNS